MVDPICKSILVSLLNINKIFQFSLLSNIILYQLLENKVRKSKIKLIFTFKKVEIYNSYTFQNYFNMDLK